MSSALEQIWKDHDDLNKAMDAAQVEPRARGLITHLFDRRRRTPQWDHAQLATEIGRLIREFGKGAPARR